MHGIVILKFICQNYHFHARKFNFYLLKCSCMKFSYHDFFMHETGSHWQLPNMPQTIPDTNKSVIIKQSIVTVHCCRSQGSSPLLKAFPRVNGRRIYHYHSVWLGKSVRGQVSECGPLTMNPWGQGIIWSGHTEPVCPDTYLSHCNKA